MRKKPQQARSRHLVDTLIEATARCVAEHGLDGTTTASVAAKAGVSVGSLYQYFDGKEDLIEALIAKLADDIGRGLMKLPMTDEVTLETRVALSIAFGFSIMHSHQGLYMELARNWHRISTQHVADVLQQYFYRATQTYLLKHYRDYPIDKLHVRIFIITNSVMFTIVRFLSQDDPLLLESEVQAGLTEMVIGFMRSPNT